MIFGSKIVKAQHLFLTPLVVLAIPPDALFGKGVVLMGLVGLVGVSGTFLARRALARAASVTLLALILWGKTTANILDTGPPDTAVLVIEFTTVIVMMEASSVVMIFEQDISRLKDRADELSEALRSRLQAWLGRQLVSHAKLGLAALGLSMLLLPIAGLTSLPSNELAFSATLALVAVIVLFFLITHRREPESR